jgi:methionyl-tRNA synthetase
MRHTLEVCRVVGVLLAPFCPNKSQELLGRLGISAPTLQDLSQLCGLQDGASLTHGDPLFPRMDELPATIAAALETAAAAAGPLKSLGESGAAKAEKKAKKSKSKSKSSAKEEPTFQTISFEDFTKVEIRVVQVISAAPHPDADRLLVLQVNAGEDTPRTIVAGIASKYSPEELVGKKLLGVLNLAPRKLRGVMSQGMLLAASGSEGILSMASTLADVAPGSRIS